MNVSLIRLDLLQERTLDALEEFINVAGARTIDPTSPTALQEMENALKTYQLAKELRDRVLAGQF